MQDSQINGPTDEDPLLSTDGDHVTIAGVAGRSFRHKSGAAFFEKRIGKWLLRNNLLNKFPEELTRLINSSGK